LTRSLLVTRDYFPPQVGGISTMMWELCAHLGPERVSCLVGLLPPKLVDSSMPESDITIHRSHLPFARSPLCKLAALATTWPRVLLPNRPDLLQFATCDDAYWGIWLRRMLGLPYVVYAHGNDVLSAAASHWTAPRRALRGAAAVFANSHYTADLLKSQIGTRTERVQVVHPGCDPQEFSPGEPDRTGFAHLPALHDAGPVLLTVGNLVERKGHDLVIQCLPALRQSFPKLRYVIVGAGPHQPALETLATELGVREAVCFAGRVPRSALPDFYRRCDVMVMPSRVRSAHHDVEGFGIVFVEANACGKPVIGGRSGGMTDAIRHGENGFVVEPGDTGHLMQHLRMVLADRELAARLGANGRRRVEAELSWSAAARRIGGVLDDIARGR
jgi:phosphatidylinositol alpha-1,6-mannosyltransferase